jgi:hypothetical protein
LGVLQHLTIGLSLCGIIITIITIIMLSFVALRVFAHLIYT